jgi:hypothetical protein
MSRAMKPVKLPANSNAILETVSSKSQYFLFVHKLTRLMVREIFTEATKSFKTTIYQQHTW